MPFDLYHKNSSKSRLQIQEPFIVFTSCQLQNCLSDAKVVEECRVRLEDYENKKNVSKCDSVKCKYK
jgi:hypothetical protein